MYKILKQTTMKERIAIVVSILFIMAQVWLELKVPEYLSEITTKLQTEGTTVQDILAPGSIMVTLSLLSLAASIFVGFIAARVASSLTKHIRSKVFNRVMDYTPGEVQQFSIPSLITRTTNDITQIQLVIAIGLQVVIKGPITAIWAVTKIADKNWQWTFSTGVAVLALLVMLGSILIFVQPKFMRIQALTDKLNSLTRENLQGIRVVRAYNADDYQNDKFLTANEELTSTNLFTSRMLAIMNPGMTIISSGLSLAVYWIGAYLIDAAELQDKLTLFSDMVVFSSYAMQVVLGFMLMTIVFLILPRAVASANRINEVLELEPSIQFKEQTAGEISEKGTVEFKDVSFAYPDAEEPVIQNVSFKANMGDTVAFIGSTGSGKSTVINLIPRFFDVTKGQILIDGKDIQDYSHEDLNNRIGYISQKPVLFSGTIRSNLDLGHSAANIDDDTQLTEALKIAEAEEFVLQKDDQLDSHVAQAGTNFSGGQKQRLSIARAVARKSEILVFDDSFSALDYKTDKTLRNNLTEKMKDTTKLIVAQRISTIMDADQILVLDAGKVVGQGTHKELLENNQVYQEIAYSQLSKEELTNG
ncbi:ABC transporter ATP-binding protein [Marinilactibacillus piezotolerans]|uniref:ABC transporter ATP-binding protein n=1 Tax=Marinilactibacillus piezotolerans TaxID=258723 RepID=UPI0009B0A16F|nr:ABC transporter ATP-binding protein [Marinilactibacillus piezotolerans]